MTTPSQDRTWSEIQKREKHVFSGVQRWISYTRCSGGTRKLLLTYSLCHGPVHLSLMNNHKEILSSFCFGENVRKNGT
jgi:hypothetical protein